MGIIGSFGAAVAEARQAAGDSDDEIEFCGERFRIANELCGDAVMVFAQLADSGATTGQAETVIAMQELIELCLADDEEWRRFRRVSKRNRVSADVLAEVCKALIGSLSGRPTVRPSSSSGGQPTTSTSPPSSSQPLSTSPDSPPRVPPRAPSIMSTVPLPAEYRQNVPGPALVPPPDLQLVPVATEGGLDLSALFDPAEAATG